MVMVFGSRIRDAISGQGGWICAGCDMALGVDCDTPVGSCRYPAAGMGVFGIGKYSCGPVIPCPVLTETHILICRVRSIPESLHCNIICC